MRENKFRAWDEEKKVMVYSEQDPYGYEWEVNKNYGVICIPFEYIDDDYGGHVCYGEHLHLMQYTGLKDKNDKEIYEGDIVRKKCNYINTGETKIRLYKVVWKEDWCAWALKKLGNCTQSCNMYKSELNFCEIVGNIYENPELLEVNENDR